jgi:uncharacterized coiled-coil DUF342 family protein
MKIDLSKEHKDKILSYIENYKNISNEQYQIYEKVKSLQKELNEVTAKLQSTENTLQSFRDEEKIYMDELHSIYGDFTLSDLYESIY